MRRCYDRSAVCRIVHRYDNAFSGTTTSLGKSSGMERLSSTDLGEHSELERLSSTDLGEHSQLERTQDTTQHKNKRKSFPNPNIERLL